MSVTNDQRRHCNARLVIVLLSLAVNDQGTAGAAALRDTECRRPIGGVRRNRAVTAAARHG